MAAKAVKVVICYYRLAADGHSLATEPLPSLFSIGKNPLKLHIPMHAHDATGRVVHECCLKYLVSMQYATWEESQKDYRRARSVWERTIDVNYQSEGVWVKYAEMEMRGRFINHARNVWDRAVSLLPRIDKLWYKYIHMEEMLGNVPGARQIFQRWINFEPDHAPWMAYINVRPPPPPPPPPRPAGGPPLACAHAFSLHPSGGLAGISRSHQHFLGFLQASQSNLFSAGTVKADESDRWLCYAHAS